MLKFLYNEKKKNYFLKFWELEEVEAFEKIANQPAQLFIHYSKLKEDLFLLLEYLLNAWIKQKALYCKNGYLHCASSFPPFTFNPKMIKTEFSLEALDYLDSLYFLNWQKDQTSLKQRQDKIFPTPPFKTLLTAFPWGSDYHTKRDFIKMVTVAEINSLKLDEAKGRQLKKQWQQLDSKIQQKLKLLSVSYAAPVKQFDTPLLERLILQGWCQPCFKGNTPRPYLVCGAALTNYFLYLRFAKKTSLKTPDVPSGLRRINNSYLVENQAFWQNPFLKNWKFFLVRLYENSLSTKLAGADFEIGQKHSAFFETLAQQIVARGLQNKFLHRSIYANVYELLKTFFPASLQLLEFMHYHSINFFAGSSLALRFNLFRFVNGLHLISTNQVRKHLVPLQHLGLVLQETRGYALLQSFSTPFFAAVKEQRKEFLLLKELEDRVIIDSDLTLKVYQAEANLEILAFLNLIGEVTVYEYLIQIEFLSKQAPLCWFYRFDKAEVNRIFKTLSKSYWSPSFEEFLGVYFENVNYFKLRKTYYFETASRQLFKRIKHLLEKQSQPKSGDKTPPPKKITTGQGKEIAERRASHRVGYTIVEDKLLFLFHSEESYLRAKEILETETEVGLLSQLE